MTQRFYKADDISNIWSYFGKVQRRIDFLENEMVTMVEANNSMVDELARMKAKYDNLVAIFYDLYPEMDPNRYGTLRQVKRRNNNSSYKYEVLDVNQY